MPRIVGPEAVIEDVDFDDEEIYLRDGTRLTEQIAADRIAEIRRRNLIPGRNR